MALFMPKRGHSYNIEGKAFTYRGKDRGKLRFVAPVEVVAGVYYAGDKTSLSIPDFNVGLQTGAVEGVTRLA
jgi:hypothetical protein